MWSRRTLTIVHFSGFIVITTIAHGSSTRYTVYMYDVQKRLSNLVEDLFNMLPEVKQIHSGVQNYSTAS